MPFLDPNLLLTEKTDLELRENSQVWDGFDNITDVAAIGIRSQKKTIPEPGDGNIPDEVILANERYIRGKLLDIYRNLWTSDEKGDLFGESGLVVERKVDNRKVESKHLTTSVDNINGYTDGNINVNRDEEGIARPRRGRPKKSSVIPSEEIPKARSKRRAHSATTTRAGKRKIDQQEFVEINDPSKNSPLSVKNKRARTGEQAPLVKDMSNYLLPPTLSNGTSVGITPNKSKLIRKVSTPLHIRNTRDNEVLNALVPDLQSGTSPFTGKYNVIPQPSPLSSNNSGSVVKKNPGRRPKNVNKDVASAAVADGSIQPRVNQTSNTNDPFTQDNGKSLPVTANNSLTREKDSTSAERNRARATKKSDSTQVDSQSLTIQPLLSPYASNASVITESQPNPMPAKRKRGRPVGTGAVRKEKESVRVSTKIAPSISPTVRSMAPKTTSQSTPTRSKVSPMFESPYPSPAKSTQQTPTTVPLVVKRGPGRPPGAKNKAKRGAIPIKKPGRKPKMQPTNITPAAQSTPINTSNTDPIPLNENDPKLNDSYEADEDDDDNNDTILFSKAISRGKTRKPPLSNPSSINLRLTRPPHLDDLVYYQDDEFEDWQPDSDPI